jgi:hypothetical protein
MIAYVFYTLGRDGVVRVSGDAVASVRWLEPTGLEGFSAVQLFGIARVSVRMR